MDDQQRAMEIQQRLERGRREDLFEGLALMARWLEHYRLELATLPSRARARRPLLWQVLAELVERTGDQRLLERFWQALDGLGPPPPPAGVLPLLGIPILNGAELLERLLASLDVPVQTLALVDNSGGPGPVRRLLERLEREGHPQVQQVRVARAFGNGGVANAWNQILRAHPSAPLALIANHDVVFPTGVLSAALAVLDAGKAQWLPLLPGADAFAAFLLTARAWGRVGLFDDGFHPAYFEDNDYRDRLEADPEVERLENGPWLEPMAAANPNSSATLAADPQLARWNEASFALNRLWYSSRRRLQGQRRGVWQRLWLGEWSPEVEA